ncbi:MAG TPA: hypothetical protein DD381_02680 [Lentisphaeria bacterium]|nr:MAG: hypothetical protein A2X47_03575 [Lentisphaerae bacterium GWF2_38_69]HBM15240.1 hypothetical protein [Lentisphaeria bacterium]
MFKKVTASALCMLSMTVFMPVSLTAEDGLNQNQAVVTPVTAPQSNSASQRIGPKKDTWGDKLLLYFPNRFVDMADMIDLSLGFGPTVKAKIWATRYVALGGGIGGSAKLIKGYNRQYGAGLESGWNASFLMLSAENMEMSDTTRGVQKYFNYYTGIPSLDNSVYNFWKGPQDMFSIGAQGAAFVEIDAEVHPFEIFDFLAGIFFLDPKGDDYTMADI